MKISKPPILIAPFKLDKYVKGASRENKFRNFCHIGTGTEDLKSSKDFFVEYSPVRQEPL